MSMALVRLGCTFPLVTASAMALSVWSGVAGCLFNDVGNVEDCPIVGRYICIGGKKEVAACATAGLWFTEVAGVTVCSKNHIASMVGENRFFLRGQVVEEL